MNNNRILVVDDEENILKALTDLLTANGYEVDTAQDGHEGIQKAYKTKPDLILLDIMMPKVSGIELLKKIKSSEKTDGYCETTISKDSLFSTFFRDSFIFCSITSKVIP